VLRSLTLEDVHRIIDAAHAHNAAHPPSGERVIPADHAKIPRLQLAHRDSMTLQRTIEALGHDAIHELKALAWIGRGDVPAATFDQHLKHARSTSAGSDVGYVMGMAANLPEYLRKAIDRLAAWT
jgi:hypothetical protein